MKDSYGVNNIKQFLEMENIEYSEEFCGIDSDFCINPLTEKRLRFDFFISNPTNDRSLNPYVIIEFDGYQHVTKHTRHSLEEIQYRDQIKNFYCYIRGIPLLRIPHFIDYSSGVSTALKLFLQWVEYKNYEMNLTQNIPVIEKSLFDLVIHPNAADYKNTKEFIEYWNRQLNIKNKEKRKIWNKIKKHK